MPLNAANKDLLTLAPGRNNRFYIQGGEGSRKVPATAEFVNESFDTDMVVQFQNDVDNSFGAPADVDPDGYSAAITIKPRATLTVAFGTIGSLNLLGPYVQVVTTGAPGQCSLTLADDTAMIMVI